MAPYQKQLNEIIHCRDEMVNTLTRWVEINSGTENLIGLAKMLNILKGAFHRFAPEPQEIALPPYAIVNEEGNLTEQPLGKALYLNVRPEAPIQVLLGGHMDTVFSASSPFQQAEMLDHQIMRGPGVADMKGGLVILLKSLEIFEKSPYAQKIGWHVLLNPDEEIGSPGSAQLLTEIAKKCHVGLLFEPPLTNGSLINARKGSMNFTVIARGKSAHAGRDFQEGKNAISALSHFIIQVEALTDIDQGITSNVGKVRGGGPLNIVPNLAICGINIRMTHPEDMQKIKKQIESIVSALNNKEGFSLELHEISARPPKPFEQKHQALFEAFNRCAHELNQELRWQTSGGVTDGNLLFAAGLPTVDALGAVGGGIHTHEEYILLDSLVEKTKLSSLFLMKLANGSFSLF